VRLFFILYQHDTPIQQQVASSSSTASYSLKQTAGSLITSSTFSNTVFTSLEAFIAFLKAHPNSRASYAALAGGNYSPVAMRQITRVTAVKVIEVFGNYPTKEQKVTVSKLLALVTGLESQNFFNPKTCKGFLNFEGLRRKLPSHEKLYVWKSKRKVKDEANTSLLQLSNSTTDGSDPSLPAFSDGCPRQVVNCPFCEG